MSYYSPSRSMAAASAYPPVAAAFSFEQRVPKFAFWAFGALFVMSLANIVALIDQMEEKAAAPYNPIAFGVAVLVIIPLTRGKSGFRYFPAAWVFVGLFGLLGLLGPKIP